MSELLAVKHEAKHSQQYLDVSVDDVVVMAVAERLKDLSHVVTENEI